MGGRKGRSGRAPKNLVEKLEEANKRGELPISLSSLEPGGMPEKPVWLDSTAEQCWDEVLAELNKMKVAKYIDTRSFILLCELWSLYRNAVEDLQQDYLNPVLAKLVLNYANQWMNIAKEFGMTPQSRSRIAVKPENKETSPLAEFGIKSA